MYIIIVSAVVFFLWVIKYNAISASYTLVLTVSVIAPLLLFEYVSVYNENTVYRNSVQQNFHYDVRTPRAVAAEISANGEDSHEAFRVFERAEGIMPLGYAPNTKIVGSNEYGIRHVFLTDRHGFNNDDRIWDHETKYLFVGDSFTEGCCTPDNKNFVNLFRGDKFDTLNLGVSGNGPETNLATLIEYLEYIQPKKVIWVHFAGNDLGDMNYYRKIKQFNLYVYGGYSQDLYKRSNTIRAYLNSFYNKVLLNEPDRYSNRKTFREIFLSKDRLTLQTIRNKIVTKFQKVEPSAKIDFERFNIIMKKAKELADSKNVEFYFVNLPHFYQIYQITKHDKLVKEIVRDLDMHYIDLREAYKEQEDIYGLYAFRNNDTGGHLSYRGNKVTSDYLKEIIQ